MIVAAAPAAEPGTVGEPDSAAAGTAAWTGFAAVAPASSAAALLGRVGAVVLAHVEEPDQPGDE
jgi:hypothetical protein